MFFGIAGVAAAQTITGTHTCLVNEVTSTGGYTYIGCQEGSSQIWLATRQIDIQTGEQISFPDVPPMVNFISKSMSRTFPRISFVPGITRSGDTASSSTSGSPSKNNIATHNNDTYSGIDDNGTIVFTDDPSKAPKSTKVRRREQKNYTDASLNKVPTSKRQEESRSNPSAPLQSPVPTNRINDNDKFSERMRRLEEKAKSTKNRVGTDEYETVVFVDDSPKVKNDKPIKNKSDADAQNSVKSEFELALTSGSMEDTIKINDKMTIYKSVDTLKQKDIVAYKFRDDASKIFTGRIVGMPGSTVKMVNKIVYINGVRYDEYEYAVHKEKEVIPAVMNPRDSNGPFTLAKDEYYILGDNRDRSYDCRFWGDGAVKKHEIVGKVVKINGRKVVAGKIMY